MIDITNYYTVTKNLDFTSFPEAIRVGHDFVTKTSEGGMDWSAYESSPKLKRVVDTYFQALETQINRTAPTSIPPTHATSTHVAPRKYTSTKTAKKEAKPKPIKKSSGGNPPPSKVESNANLVERIPEELKFMKRYVSLDGKTKMKEEILRFLNAVQKAILEKRIRKTSMYAKQVKYMQEKLIAAYNNMGNQFKVKIEESVIEEFENLIEGESIYPSVKFIKRYINISGKPGMKHKAGLLKKQMAIAVGKNKITKSDPYSNKISELFKNLTAFVENKKQTELVISESELNGLNGILGHCGCSALHGFEEEETFGNNAKPVVMNSMDFANMRFNTIGLKDKWFKLIGDPSSNFTAMVFGKPKMGKSYLCVDFAGYLARHHGKVLYVAKEEGLDLTLQQKLNDKNVKHPNLFVASELPNTLSSYDFIFLDSVNKLGLSAEDLTMLKKRNPTKSFIFVFQSTKEGNFRGTNEFQHDVDIVIEVPEKGKAVQFGRFNQGGEMNIF